MYVEGIGRQLVAQGSGRDIYADAEFHSDELYEARLKPMFGIIPMAWTTGVVGRLVGYGAEVTFADTINNEAVIQFRKAGSPIAISTLIFVIALLLIFVIGAWIVYRVITAVEQTIPPELRWIVPVTIIAGIGVVGLYFVTRIMRR